jgi:hypothetical protein
MALQELVWVNFDHFRGSTTCKPEFSAADILHRATSACSARAGVTAKKNNTKDSKNFFIVDLPKFPLKDGFYIMTTIAHPEFVGDPVFIIRLRPPLHADSKQRFRSMISECFYILTLTPA